MQEEVLLPLVDVLRELTRVCEGLAQKSYAAECALLEPDVGGELTKFRKHYRESLRAVLDGKAEGMDSEKWHESIANVRATLDTLRKTLPQKE